MFRTLVIGFGNLDRADDGVAFHVMNALRRRLGQAVLNEYDTGLDQLGSQTDTIFLSQLVPELMEEMLDYRRVIFVDAHVHENMEDLHCAALTSDEDASLTFTHHLTPAILLALLKTLYHHELMGYIISVRGYDFDFHRSLSTETEALIAPAVQNIMELLAS
jgi:hydrogenase maturation protease